MAHKRRAVRASVATVASAIAVSVAAQEPIRSPAAVPPGARA